MSEGIFSQQGFSVCYAPWLYKQWSVKMVWRQPALARVHIYTYSIYILMKIIIHVIMLDFYMVFGGTLDFFYLVEGSLIGQ